MSEGGNVSHGVEAVKYIGIATTRIITADQWRDQQGVRNQADTVWDSSNGFTILGARLKDGAVQYLRDDPEFAVIDVESTA